MSEESVLPKGITKDAKIWSSYIAREVKVKPADNHSSLFLIGRTLLDKEAFNKLNDTEHDVVHGVQVIYGPFQTKASGQEFVSEYELEWPGENDWRWIKAGQVEIISSFYDPGMADIVHNASNEFQAQLAYQEVQRRISEMEEVQRRIAMRETEESLKKKPLTQKEKDAHLQWQDQKIKQAEDQLLQLKKHRVYLENLPAIE